MLPQQSEMGQTASRTHRKESLMVDRNTSSFLELCLVLLSLGMFSIKLELNAILSMPVSCLKPSLKVPPWHHKTHSLQHGTSGFSKPGLSPCSHLLEVVSSYRSYFPQLTHSNIHLFAHTMLIFLSAQNQAGLCESLAFQGSIRQDWERCL